MVIKVKLTKEDKDLPSIVYRNIRTSIWGI